MGTRALTHFYDGNEVVATLYRQFDGYPAGHGAELAKLLAGRGVTNGIPIGGECKAFNGPGDLAVRVIAGLKAIGSRHKDGRVDWPGDLYLLPPGASDCCEEWVYKVRVEGKRVVVEVVHVFGDKQVFAGSPEDLLAKYGRSKEGGEDAEA
jgi:hypothetical protein